MRPQPSDSSNGTNLAVQSVAMELNVSCKGSKIKAVVNKAWSAFGRLEVLVNNVGIQDFVAGYYFWCVLGAEQDLLTALLQMSQRGTTDGSQGGFPWKSQPSRSSNLGGSDKRSERLTLLESQPNCSKSSSGEKRGRNTRAENNGSSSRDRGDGESNRKKILAMEKGRRKKERDMFSNLHELLPDLPPKATKVTIVNEAVDYINSLKQTLQNLEKQKLERMQELSFSFNEPSSSMAPPQIQRMDSRETIVPEQGKDWTRTISSPVATIFSLPSNSSATFFSPNVVLNVSGVDAHISICTVKKPKILSGIFGIMQKYMLEVVYSYYSSDDFKSMYMIHARVTEGGQYLQAFVIEELFKSAADEMLNFLSQ